MSGGLGFVYTRRARGRARAMVEFTESELVYAHMLLGRALLDALDV